MKKKFIVKENKEFQKVINNGICRKNKSFVIYSLENELSYNKYGISVSKKHGNAVFRNKYKRIIRSIVDNYKKLYINHKDYIIILRKDAIDCDYELLTKELFSLLNHD